MRSEEKIIDGYRCKFINLSHKPDRYYLSIPIVHESKYTKNGCTLELGTEDIKCLGCVTYPTQSADYSVTIFTFECAKSSCLDMIKKNARFYFGEPFNSLTTPRYILVKNAKAKRMDIIQMISDKFDIRLNVLKDLVIYNESHDVEVHFNEKMPDVEAIENLLNQNGYDTVIINVQ